MLRSPEPGCREPGWGILGGTGKTLGTVLQTLRRPCATSRPVRPEPTMAMRGLSALMSEERRGTTVKCSREGKSGDRCKTCTVHRRTVTHKTALWTICGVGETAFAVFLSPVHCPSPWGRAPGKGIRVPEPPPPPLPSLTYFSSLDKSSPIPPRPVSKACPARPLRSHPTGSWNTALPPKNKSEESRATRISASVISFIRRRYSPSVIQPSRWSVREALRAEPLPKDVPGFRRLYYFKQPRALCHVRHNLPLHVIVIRLDRWLLVLESQDDLMSFYPRMFCSSSYQPRRYPSTLVMPDMPGCPVSLPLGYAICSLVLGPFKPVYVVEPSKSQGSLSCISENSSSKNSTVSTAKLPLSTAKLPLTPERRPTS